MTENARIGLFLCRCGGNISGMIDTKIIKDSIANEEKDIVFSSEDDHLCSIDGQKTIADSIKRFDINRIVLGCCSPLLHETTFKRCIDNAGLNAYMLEIANIREQCSWSVKDKNIAQAKAKTILQGALEKVKKSTPLDRIKIDTKKSVVIIGGGVAGITAALSLSKNGFDTHIIENRETIGGNMVRVGKVFSPDRLAEECALCSLSPLMNDVACHPKIKLHTLSSVKSISGYAGNFKVTVEKKPSFVDAKKCIGCGDCSQSCPESVPDWWNANMKLRKAIYRPFPQAVPSTFTIDDINCKRCGLCIDVCSQGAIDFGMKPQTITIDSGAIIIATGHSEYDVSQKSELGYGRFKDVITQTELSRITAVNGPTFGNLQRPSDQKPPRRVVMIQCVGSRDEKPNSNKYCSKICCMVAIKHANHIKSFSPYTDVVICYTDLRTPGNYEHYLRHAQENGVRFIRGKPSEVAQENGFLTVKIEDTLSKEILNIETDLVVLSEAIEPSKGTTECAEILSVSLGQDGFIKEKHPKLNPISTDIEGIFSCGTALGPKDITDSVTQANAAAVKSMELLYDDIRVEPLFVNIDMKKCDSCGICIPICKYHALYRKDGNVGVDYLACVGCGGCINTCPKDTISQKYFTNDQILAQITGLLKNKKINERRIIAFLDSKVAYVAADNAGVNKLCIGDDIYVIRVPSTNRIDLRHILHAIRNGADGVFLGEGPENGPMGKMFANIQDRVSNLRSGLSKNNIDPRRIFFTKVYAPHYRGFVDKIELFRRELETIK